MGENRRAKGSYYEEVAAAFLERHGLRIQERNFRCRLGEIDLIAREGEVHVFVEVKYRSSSYQGAAAAAVDAKKQLTIRRVAMFYLIQTFGTVDRPCRFDVIAIEGNRLRWIPNAF